MYSEESIIDLVRNGTVISISGSNKIVRISDELVVKFGRTVHKAEAESMRLIRQKTFVKVPEVISVFESSGRTYITMKYIKGNTLDKIWNNISIIKKMDILHQLKRYLFQIRRIKSNIPNDQCIGPWFPQEGINHFENMEDIVEWLNQMIFACKSWNVWNMGNSKFEVGTTLVFTHQDIHMKNLLVDENSKLWILDWEFSGYYPHYFEYSSTRFSKSESFIWNTLAPLTSGYYPKEFKMLENIRKLVMHT